MASSTSSLPPRSTSPASTPLESLVSHLVAAKRSLTSIEQVWQANEIVTSTRKSLENSVITSARTSFLRSGITAQLHILEQVHGHNKSVEDEGAKEYEDALDSVGKADRRLNDTLARLRNTMVEPSLRPDREQSRSLLDFVDESGVDTVLKTIEESTKAAKVAYTELVEINRTFSDDIGKARKLLKKTKLPERGTLLKDSGESSTFDASARSPLPGVLEKMEDHAKEMADNLESLVKHFDLCVTAIRYTEGGGDAARHITDDIPEGVGIGQETAQAPPDPIGEHEHQEMLEVLEKDASQVEEVVMENRDHHAEMETQFESVNAHLQHVDEAYADLTRAFKLLEELEARLHAFIAQGQVFVMRWDDEKAKIDERMEELRSLGDFYDGYLRSYDHLLVEIGRRQFMEQQMEQVVHDALSKIDRLYEEDVGRRESFKNEHGDYLPVDIWPGLMQAPLQFEVTPVEGAGKVPDISKSTIQQAIRRVQREG